MLDDDGGRLIELERDARGRVEIEEVGVRELFSLQDDGPAEAGRHSGIRVPRGLLMRVFAVPQIADLLERQVNGLCQTGAYVTMRA